MLRLRDISNLLLLFLLTCCSNHSDASARPLAPLEFRERPLFEAKTRAEWERFVARVEERLGTNAIADRELLEELGRAFDRADDIPSCALEELRPAHFSRPTASPSVIPLLTSFSTPPTTR